MVWKNGPTAGSVVLAAAVSLVLSGSTAVAAALGGDLENFATRFNATAKTLDMSTRMAKDNCQRGVRTVCQYRVDKSLGALADSADGKTLESIVYIFGGEKPNPLSFMQTLLITMAIYAPRAEPAERGVVMKALLDDLGPGKEAEASLHGVKFRMSATTGLGVWLTVSRRD